MLSTAKIAVPPLDDTPTRKRKREIYAKTIAAAATAASLANCLDQAPSAACFTNAAFSSTPKKLIAKRRAATKENKNPNPNSFNQNALLEVKSIADIVINQQLKEAKTATNGAAILALNPFEVVRKPPKKKKCEDACFENPALNLELPEKQFNPYEVVRVAPTPSRCFINEALNLRSQDVPASLNPFEIQRPAIGVENPALSTVEHHPSGLKIGLPFKPTIGCRIDFKDMSLSQLTPSKLFAEKLVFSPVPAPKRSLGAIIEETTMDIGKELDLYQLELENSINEAKLRKTNSVELVQPFEVVEQRKTCTHALTEITEISTEEDEEQQQSKVTNEQKLLQAKTPEQEPLSIAPNDNADVAYASDDSETELEANDFKAPTRFVRAYRPAASQSLEKLKGESKESLHSLKSNKSDKSDDLKTRSSLKVGHMIRKSIRKLIHPMHKTTSTTEEQMDDLAVPLNDEKCDGQHNIMSSIRHSLRRRTNKTNLELANEAADAAKAADISIIDTSERVMKLKSMVIQTEYIKIEQLTNERKRTLRNSIKRSTREVMRHVFHKNQDAYATKH